MGEAHDDAKSVDAEAGQCRVSGRNSRQLSGILRLGQEVPPGSPAKAEEATTAALTTPALTGPLSANPNPINFDTGFPLGKFYFGGALTGMGMFQSNPVSGNHGATVDAPSALVWLQNNEGPFQVFAMAGGYSFPTLGTHTSISTRLPGTRSGRFRWPTVRWS